VASLAKHLPSAIAYKDTMKLGRAGYRTDQLGTVQGTCPHCARAGSNQLERGYTTLDLLGFLPARYAGLTYRQRCMGCGQVFEVAPPDGAPPMPFAYRFGWILIVLAVVGGCSLYFARMGACGGTSSPKDPAVAAKAYDTKRQDEAIAAARPLVAALRSAESACMSQVLDVQRAVAPDPLAFKDRAPTDIAPLKEAKPFALPGEGGMLVDPWWVQTDPLCKINISKDLAAYGAGSHLPSFMDVDHELTSVRAKLATLAPAVVVVTAWRCSKVCRAGAVWISIPDKKVLAATIAETAKAEKPSAEVMEVLAAALRAQSDWKYE
jgi:hypothetical protein